MNQHETTLPHKIYDDTLKRILFKNLSKSLNYYDIVCSSGSAKGDNYVGIIYRIQAIEKDTNEIKLSLIAKFPPQSKVQREEFMTGTFFIREADFYDNVYSIYKRFQIEKGIDIEKDGFHYVPFCYETLTKEPYEGLFLEDLKYSGFEMFDRFMEVTKEHVELVMKSLAKMHAIFFAIKDQNPKLIEHYYEMKDIILIFCDRENSGMPGYYKTLIEQTLEVINKSKNDSMIAKINQFLKNDMVELLKKCFDRENTEPYAVLCHGDCWNNNILFKNDEKGTPIDLRLLDFQIMRYASPVCDLVYYIFGCTSKSLRDKYYHDFMNIYYDELSNFMQRLGSDSMKMFPRSAFDQHLKDFGHFGLIMAMMVLPVFTCASEDVPEMEDFAESFKEMGENRSIRKDALNFTTEKTFHKYAERMLGVCEDMCSLGCIS